MGDNKQLSFDVRKAVFVFGSTQAGCGPYLAIQSLAPWRRRVHAVFDAIGTFTTEAQVVEAALKKCAFEAKKDTKYLSQN